MSKINEITVLNKNGTKSYIVGREYGGMTLDRISDCTGGGDIHVPHFCGFTANGEAIFEVIGAPVDVEYARDASAAANIIAEATKED